MCRLARLACLARSAAVALLLAPGTSGGGGGDGALPSSSSVTTRCEQHPIPWRGTWPGARRGSPTAVGSTDAAFYLAMAPGGGIVLNITGQHAAVGSHVSPLFQSSPYPNVSISLPIATGELARHREEYLGCNQDVGYNPAQEGKVKRGKATWHHGQPPQLPTLVRRSTDDTAAHDGLHGPNATTAVRVAVLMDRTDYEVRRYILILCSLFKYLLVARPSNDPSHHHPTSESAPHVVQHDHAVALHCHQGAERARRTAQLPSTVSA